MPPASPPAVSVVIATRGRPHLVRRSVESVLQQSFRDLELFVVVDGPDEATETALREVTDPRFTLIVNPSNLGSAEARMVGVEAARGRWIALLDDDDEWLPEKLARQLEAVERAATDERDRLIVTTLMNIVSPMGDGVRPLRPYDGTLPFDVWLFDRTLVRNGAIFQTSAVLAPLALMREVRFRRCAHDDWDFALRAIHRRGARIVTVPTPLVRHYRDDATPRLSNDHKIAESLAWLDELGDAVSRRGYSAFCLTVMATHAVDRRGFGWFWPLLSRAFRNGSPTVRQVLAFFALWLVGKAGRRRGVGLLVDRKEPPESVR